MCPPRKVEAHSGDPAMISEVSFNVVDENLDCVKEPQVSKNDRHFLGNFLNYLLLFESEPVLFVQNCLVVSLQ